MRFFGVLACLTAFLWFLLPTAALAQGLAPNCGVPGPGSTGYCELCHVVALINRVLDFIIIDLSWPVAAILFAYAGFLYLTSRGDTGQTGRARSIFTDVAVGFIIILVSWILIDTIMQTLVHPGTLHGPWNEIQCVGGQGAPPESGSTDPGSVTPLPPGPPGGPGTVTADGGRAQLAGAGISVNNATECPAGVTYAQYEAQTGNRCTSIGGMQQSTIDSTIALQEACKAANGGNCSIIVTGGAELGHTPGTYSHETGYKVDIARPDPEMDAHIQSLVGDVPLNSNSEPFVDSLGNTLIFRNEGNHWDVQVIPPGQ